MSRSILIALFVSSVILAGFVFFSQQYRSNIAGSATVPSLAASAAPTDSPLPTPVPPPAILYRQPATAILENNRPTIYLAFDQPMDAASLQSALLVTPTIPLKQRWVANTLYITPDLPLAGATIYTFTITTAARNFQDLYLPAAYTWSYRSPTAAIGVTMPTDHPDGFASIAFDSPLDPSATNLQKIRLEPPLAITERWLPDSNQLTIVPQMAFSPETTYTIHFAESLLDQDGYAVDLPPLHFTTPPLVRTTWMAGSSGINPTTPVTFEFTPLFLHGIDTAATAASLQISPTITGTVGWHDATLIFTPTRGYLEPQTNYALTISPVLIANDGSTALADPIAWRFTTGDLPRWFNFGNGAKVQVVALDSTRTIDFQRNPDIASYPNASYAIDQVNGPTTASFTLHPLTLEQVRETLPGLEGGYNGTNTILLGGMAGEAAMAAWSVPIQARTAEQQQIDPYGNLGTMRLNTTVPATVAPGAYLLSMNTGYVNDQLLLLISDQSLVVKQSKGELLTWASRFDGTALAHKTILIIDSAGKSVAEGVTDDAGLFRTALPSPVDSWFALAYDGATDSQVGQILLVGSSWSWRTATNAGIYWGSGELPQHYSTYLYTDRPIYRPGQMVHFKGIIRNDEDALLSVPAPATPVTVRILDERHNTVRTYDLDTNTLGAFHGDFSLAAGAMLGSYTVEAQIGGELHAQLFQVEAYHKPEYTVDIAVDAPDLRVGSLVTVTVTSRYLNGKPVAGGQVTLNHYFLGRNGSDGSTPFGARVMSGYPLPATTIDDEGRAVVAFLIGNTGPSLTGWADTVRWAIEATVRDAANQQVSNYAIIDQTMAQGQLVMTLPAATILPGELFELQLAATDQLGASVPYANMQLRVDSPEPGGVQPNGQPLRKPGVYSVDLTTDRQGVLQLPMRFDEPGYYQLNLSRYDAKGLNINPVTQSLLVYDERQPWPAAPDGFLAISAPDHAFRPGEMVPLEIMSSFHAIALLTVERGTVRRTQSVELIPPRTMIELPLIATDSPNLFVTINAWTPARDNDNTMQSQRGYRLRTATTQLTVTPVNKRLTVTLTSDRQSYAPRDNAAFTLRVVDETGAPVQAELSFALVDEAIFQLSEDLLPSIYDTFYTPRQHQVTTLDGTAPTRSFGAWGGGGGGGGFDAGNPRWSFPDTAIWLPEVTTDGDGEAIVTVPLPDTLTTWRAVVKAVTLATQVGEANATVVTELPVSIQPLLPASLTVSDEALLSLLLHNNTATTQTLTVTIGFSPTVVGDADDTPLTLGTSTTQTITVAPARTAVIGWPATVTSAGQVGLLFSATGAAQSDAILVPLTIQPAAIRTVAVEVGYFRGTLTKTVTIPAPLTELSQVTIELSRSTAGSMITGLDYLTGYPYGCVEQTMSLALPNAVVGRAFQQLGFGDPNLRRQLPELINAGLQRLYAFQHGDGGWGWWENDNSDEYQTAWVIFGLGMTSEAGYEVDENVIARGVGFLRQRLLDMEQRTRAFALYALALVEPEEQNDLLIAMAAQADELDTFSQAALALALHRIGDNDSATRVIDLLQSTAVAKGGNIYWPILDSDGVYQQKTMASATRTTALALSAFTAIRPDDPQIPGMVQWLLAQRQGYGWGTTNETSFTLLALTDHLLAMAREDADAAFTLWLNGRPVVSGTMDSLQPSTLITLTSAELAADLNALEIVTTADTRLYYRLLQSTYDSAALWQPAGVVQVQRDYLDPTTRAPLQEVVIGQLVAIQLTVQLDRRHSYVLVEDRLPGGLRAINDQLANERNAVPGYADLLVNFGELGYNQKEIRDDRVTFFVTEMPAGTWQVSYLARATTPGAFVARPTEAYAMYDLAQWGRTGGSRLIVTEE